MKKEDPMVNEKNPKCKIEKCSRTLKCVLTPDEFKERSTEMANTQAEIERLSAELAAYSADMKDQIKGLSSELRSLARVVREVSEMRKVECEQVLDYEDTSAYVVRQDTGEVIERRPLTDGERQMRMA